MNRVKRVKIHSEITAQLMMLAKQRQTARPKKNASFSAAPTNRSAAAKNGSAAATNGSAALTNGSDLKSSTGPPNETLQLVALPVYRPRDEEQPVPDGQVNLLRAAPQPTTPPPETNPNGSANNIVMPVIPKRERRPEIPEEKASGILSWLLIGGAVVFVFIIVFFIFARKRSSSGRGRDGRDGHSGSRSRSNSRGSEA